MPLYAGTEEATSGMAEAIYLEIDAVLRPPMEEGDVAPKDVAQCQEAWKKLGYAVAAGVVQYLRRDPPPEDATDPEHAEVLSSSAEDEAFWSWLGDFVGRLQTWAADPLATSADLKTSLREFLSANPVPEELEGVIR
jgi:hypothetical protein